MDKELLNFLRDKTEMGRMEAAEIESIFALMEQAGWHVVRQQSAEIEQRMASDGPAYAAALAAEEERSELSNPTTEGTSAAMEGDDVPDGDAVK